MNRLQSTGIHVFSLVLLTLFLSFPAAVLADQNAHFKKKGPGGAKIKPVGLVNSSNGGVYKKGDFGVIFKFITFDMDELYDGSDSIDMTRPKMGKAISGKAVNMANLTFRYGIMDKLDARIIIPYLDKELDRVSAKKDFSDSNSGIGDIKLISRYSIFSQRRKDPFNLAMGIGVKFPTGSTDEKDSSGKTPGFIQTGSGSWDPIVEMGAHKVKGRQWFSTYFMYQMTNEGELGKMDFEKGDLFKYNFGYGYALSRLFDLQLELNGDLRGKAEKNGIEQKNSGGHVVYITPGVHVKFNKKIHFDVGVALPAYRDLNGKQVSEDYRLVTKLACKF